MLGWLAAEAARQAASHLAAPAELQPVARWWHRRATTTADLLAAEAKAAGPPALEPLHFRCAPSLPDPRTSGPGAFLAGLLSPARAGVILLRSDLVSAAQQLGAGARVAERSYVVRSLLAQDRASMLGWLAAEGRISTGYAHRALERLAGELPDFGESGFSRPGLHRTLFTTYERRVRRG